MSEAPFHRTRMGARFYESTVPRLIDAIERLAAALERIADSQVRAGQPQPSDRKDNENDSESC